MAKKLKKKKLDSIPKINRRLFKLWSLAVRSRANNKCEYCGCAIGEKGKGENPITKVDAHHLVSRYMKDSPLKFSINNGISVCVWCHKFSEDSFHQSPITTMDWLIKNQKWKFDFVLANFPTKVDLKNRSVLAKIEEYLVAGQQFEFNVLTDIEAATAKPTDTSEPLFDTPVEPGMPNDIQE